MKNYDFGGWATKNDICCSDGLTIRKNAFKQNDGTRVPLVWNHSHNDPLNVLGHADLENRDGGVYARCTLNDTQAGKTVRQLIKHGDITALSIYANKLKKTSSGDVLHGDIKEVSLVLAGANPGAIIDSSDVAVMHGDDASDSMVISFIDDDDAGGLVMHSDEVEDEEPKEEVKEEPEKVIEHSDAKEETNKESGDAKMAEEVTNTTAEDEGGETVQDVFNTLTDKQKKVVYALIGQALEDAKNGGSDAGAEGDGDMKHNVFDNDGMNNDDVISHSDIQEALEDAKAHGGRLSAVFTDHGIGDIVAHSIDAATGVERPDGSVTYGVNGASFLFPDAHELNKMPKFLKGDVAWVDKIMKGTSHTPFAKVKCTFADDMTEDEARARGYITGRRKKEAFFSLIRRSVSPTTVYVKQKMDRDQVTDITDFDVVQWINGRMDQKLDMEVARAALIGDGREGGSEDKIDEHCIRPVLNDNDLFVIRHELEDTNPNTIIDGAVEAQEDYQGSGNTTCFMTRKMLNSLLLVKDVNGRRIYKDEHEVAMAMGVKEIVTFPQMKGLKDKDNKLVHAIILDLSDYSFGADKGGAKAFFDDFDIDFNQMKYLKEGRCSGMLTEPYSAIVLRDKEASI